MGLDFEYIHGQTPLDEDEKDGLKIKTISTRGELDEFEQANIELAIEWNMASKFSRNTILTIEFIKKVHKMMFSEVWEWAGSFRTTDKNIGVDKHLIEQELKVLLDDCSYWIDNKIFSADEIAIRFKHRMVKIHPFPNGNGRHSRICANILIKHVLNKPEFTWGSMNLVGSGNARDKYLQALYEADLENIEPLIRFARS